MINRNNITIDNQKLPLQRIKAVILEMPVTTALQYSRWESKAMRFSQVARSLGYFHPLKALSSSSHRMTSAQEEYIQMMELRNAIVEAYKELNMQQI